MNEQQLSESEVFLPKSELQSLIDLLRNDGMTVVGPTIDQQAIVYDEITSVDELPRGWTDRQEPGKYRLEQRDDDATFGFVVGPHSWKKYLFPPLTTVSTAEKTDQGWQMQTPEPDSTRYAFLGVRACELAAIAVQDRVFTGGPYIDPVYSNRRKNAFIIAVNCTEAAPTCFCSSMNTGPECRSGFDLALTELDDGFVVQAGSEAGETLIARLNTSEITTSQSETAGQARQQAVDQQSRHMNTDGIRDLLLGSLKHPRWEEVGNRCLGCTNCTMVCPTCFCSSVEDVTALSGESVERKRHWDSCFNLSFSYISHGTTRDTISHRYRQWLTHKLASWHDQFDTSGCVGCGRCITWCPVGIDLTEEVAAIRGNGDSSQSGGQS
ncbi:MAG: 4Fe-4S dicluster domain-containing protein [Planctomycetaceae bacterium]|nr:4Fe-4S dicluster domain-containing protein [Planctomycetaceae bacterium]